MSKLRAAGDALLDAVKENAEASKKAGSHSPAVAYAEAAKSLAIAYEHLVIGELAEDDDPDLDGAPKEPADESGLVFRAQVQCYCPRNPEGHLHRPDRECPATPSRPG